MEMHRASATSDALEAGVRGCRALLTRTKWGCRNPASCFCSLRDPPPQTLDMEPQVNVCRTREGGFEHGAKPTPPCSQTLIDRVLG